MGFSNHQAAYTKRLASETSFGAPSTTAPRGVVTILNSHGAHGHGLNDHDPNGHGANARDTTGGWPPGSLQAHTVQNRAVANGFQTAPAGSALADTMPSVFNGLPVPRDLNAVVEYLRTSGRTSDAADGTPDAKPGITALFSSYFNAVMEQAPHLSGAAADTAMQTLMQLASAAREVVPAEAEPVRCIRSRRVEAVRQFVEDNMHRSDLTPARVSRALGMSVRQLHLLFEPSDTSFSRYMLSRRLERARSLLAQQPNRSVLDIMLACGIESSTVFYRGFRKAFGMNPTDYRRALPARV